MSGMLTAPGFKARKGKEKITMVTTYDATFARLVEAAGMDAILVGDSLGMVIQGHDSTIPVTLDEVIYHTKCVRRGLSHTHLVADLPFLTFQINAAEAVRNAGKLMQKGGAHSVKIEGGVRSADAVFAIVSAGIPVMGHIGLTPQSVHQFGGHKVQGRQEEAAQQLMEDAIAIEEAGAYALVLETIPKPLAEQITKAVTIPTIGIGASNVCDGQVLVIQDLLGMDAHFNPKFLKKYDDLSTRIHDALSAYVAEVKAGTFPTDEHSFF